MTRSRSSSISSTGSGRGAGSGGGSSTTTTVVLPRRTHHPVVHSMISSNLLKDCNEIQDMVSQCMDTKDTDSFMCRTAHKYMSGCHQ
eukprot:CAMPEP_0113503908 /NCGR_PEP_ID=MMETSP0014_2-20120614/34431_1 /TAXON_ID=2857 /ORGANISM="Nitzschia sp." /LENGTH=86 /DNA_ID=CAMNT_0000398979 /DNA_START=77 /DNA_END=337 /DNA_ORIENTATION=- /assembly_acc=CAM_ASM_000159